VIIASAADERFVPHFATMLHSAWTHHREVEFYLLDCGIEPATLATLAEYADRLGIGLTTIKVDIAPLRDLPTTKFWSVAIYARLLIPNLLPPIDRVLYLDADCVVVGDLTALWRMDMGSAAVAGVRDLTAAYLEKNPDIDVERYVNSGVLLMNLPVWRRDYLTEALLTYIREHTPSFVDQSAINAVLADVILILAEDYNLMLGQTRRRLMQWTPPRIIHFTGTLKPWLHRETPFAAIYMHHRNQTPFPIVPPQTDHRSQLRRFANLIVGRRKYWVRLIMGRRSRTFVGPYLSAIASRGLHQPAHSRRRDHDLVERAEAANEQAN
jgi:lipopolysaccharide biosynthesis glycosyltransferase